MKAQATIIPVLYTTNETAAFLKVSRRELGRMIERGEIAYDYNRKGHKLFTEENIIEFINSIKVKI
jgi:hypothetical protein